MAATLPPSGLQPPLSLVQQIEQLKGSIAALREATARLTAAFDEYKARVAKLEQKVG